MVYKGRKTLMDPRKERYARETNARTLGEVIAGADVFLGVSAPGVLKKEMVAKMGERPLILALANPTPEILPEEVREVRPDAVIATGRSDYPNQVNNVLGFPYIFRGALDVRATTINMEMKIAAANALAMLAREDVPDEVASAYDGARPRFGREYIIPAPFDPRLIRVVPAAVAKAAMETGVLPWVKPWSSTNAGLPKNARTGRSYSGANVILLWITQQEHGYSSNKWLTFKQAQELGGSVRKGEKGTTVTFVSRFEKSDDAGNVASIPFLKSFNVFNVEQSVTDDVGLFGRWSWNDGRNEIMAFTDIDASLSGGVLRRFVERGGGLLVALGAEIACGSVSFIVEIKHRRAPRPRPGPAPASTPSSSSTRAA